MLETDSFLFIDKDFFGTYLRRFGRKKLSYIGLIKTTLVVDVVYLGLMTND